MTHPTFITVSLSLARGCPNTVRIQKMKAFLRMEQRRITLYFLHLFHFPCYMYAAYNIRCFKIAIYSLEGAKCLVEPKERFIRTDERNKPILASLYEVVGDALDAWEIDEYTLTFIKHPTYYETHQFRYSNRECCIHVWEA